MKLTEGILVGIDIERGETNSRYATEEEAKSILAAWGGAWEWTEDEDFGFYGATIPSRWAHLLETEGVFRTEIELTHGEVAVIAAEMS